MSARRLVRCALTQTRNAYPLMPATVEDLPSLQDKLDDVRQANVAHNVDLIQHAATAGARIICLGELCTAPYFALYTHPMWLAFAEDAESGPSVQAFRAAAQANRIIVIAPIFEQDARSGKRFNTAVVIDEHGQILGKYRKTHIPCGQNDRGSFHETFYYGSSDGNLGVHRANIARNPFFPVNTLTLMRGAAAAQIDGLFERYHPAMFKAMWVDGQNLNDLAVVGAVLAEAGIDAARMAGRLQDQDVKDRLKNTTDEAVARGVFGAPTSFVDDLMFFGNDRLPFVEMALTGSLK